MTSQERIRKARRHVGLTQQELARTLGCSERTVASWESKKLGVFPSMRLLRDVSTVTGRSIPWLLGEENQ